MLVVEGMAGSQNIHPSRESGPRTPTMKPFRVHRVEVADRSDLADAVKDVPTLIVVEANRVEARLDHPRNCVEIAKLLAPWLR